MQFDRPLFGIALMLGFCVLAPFADALAKLLGGVLPLLALMWIRFVIQCVVLAPLVASRGWPRLSSRVWVLMSLRNGLQLVGVALMFTGVRYLPLADAVAIAYVMPFMALALGWAFLGETLGWRRWLACAVGFAGTLMVMQPSFAAVGWPVLYPVGVAVVFSVFMIVTRQVASAADPLMLQMINGVQSVLVLSLLALVLPWPETGWAEWQVAALAHWELLLGLGLAGTVAHLMMTWSLRYAPASTLAPMQYIEIPVAALVGWLIFGDLPNGLAAAGIVVTMGAGLCVIWREQHLEATGSEATQ